MSHQTHVVHVSISQEQAVCMIVFFSPCFRNFYFSGLFSFIFLQFTRLFPSLCRLHRLLIVAIPTPKHSDTSFCDFPADNCPIAWFRVAKECSFTITKLQLWLCWSDIYLSFFLISTLVVNVCMELPIIFFKLLKIMRSMYTTK